MDFENLKAYNPNEEYYEHEAADLRHGIHLVIPESIYEIVVAVVSKVAGSV